MPSTPLRIATRQSRLALWQAEHVRQRLQALHPGLHVDLVPMTTQGDQLLDSPLSRLGGKGLFVKELETALLEGRADLAVHSMKDVPAQFPAGLGIAVILEREDPCDAFVSSTCTGLAVLPQGARVGTASQRRQMQLKHRRPDLQIGLLRGNVETRLRKLDENQFDAIVLACAGLKRLGLEARIRERLTPEISLPACGQGAIGIECREDDAQTRALVAPLEHPATRIPLTAERALNAALGGSCQLPLAAFAEWSGTQLRVRGCVGMPDGSRLVAAEKTGEARTAAALGQQVAEQLLADGADRILSSLGLR